MNNPEFWPTFGLIYAAVSCIISFACTTTINAYYFKFKLTSYNNRDIDLLCLITIFVPAFLFAPLSLIVTLCLVYRMSIKHMKEVREEITKEEMKAFKKMADKKLKEAKEMVDYYNEEKFDKYNKLLDK